MAVDSIVGAVIFVIEELGVFAIGATVVGWVAKNAISQYFDKELTKYQSEIDKELQRYQTELEKDKLQFSELHTERAQITAELYERFVIFEEDMKKATDIVGMKSDPPRDELVKEAAESGTEFIKFYKKNKIYFPPDVCKTVEELQEEMSSIFAEFRIFKPYESGRHQPKDLDRWTEIWEKVSKEEVPELKQDLENQFRTLLGVDTDN
ncbi:hypothetical protein [Halorubrum salsamenti]|uniref:hypothetical protein n=1 Tax=Halorubrum salsamenti TaxID=2583990 RepID=UPI0011A312AB|nr:hypothetical protein [Halorubrum salsamenti]